MREKVGKSRFTVFFQWFVAQEGRKVGSLKRRVRSQLKRYKTPQVRTTFGSWDVEKVCPVVARSTFPSQNVQNTPWWDHFWKFSECRMTLKCGMFLEWFLLFGLPHWLEYYKIEVIQQKIWPKVAICIGSFLTRWSSWAENDQKQTRLHWFGAGIAEICLNVGHMFSCLYDSFEVCSISDTPRYPRVWLKSLSQDTLYV